jgi:hypothetical protein
MVFHESNSLYLVPFSISAQIFRSWSVICNNIPLYYSQATVQIGNN